MPNWTAATTWEIPDSCQRKNSRAGFGRSWNANPWMTVAICTGVVAFSSIVMNFHLYGLLRACSHTSQRLAERCATSDRVEFEYPGFSPRALATNQPSTSSSQASGQASHHGHHGPHQHDALLFLFMAIIVGVCILHLKYIHIFHSLQETVALFVIGMIYSLVLHGLDVGDDLGKFGDSYLMWMDIDPHLLLFTLLPALLTGDAMTIDTGVAKRVAWQCLYLAGPGVLINAMLAACFLKFYLGWSFLLSLVTGSILCATDPVAVVALLKELGASPVLTIQIQGESLLNDGTAIVLYSVAYKMLQGESFDMPKIIMFLITVALMAWALGMAIGYVFYHWIRFADNMTHHNSEIIQIALTIACGYCSFVLAEGVFAISGVLSTVASALTLAHYMWPHVVAPDSMHDIWHMLETLGNIIIFFLAGALTGKAMVEIDLIDIVHLFVIYIVLTLIRGGMIFLSRPLLRFLHADKAPVTFADAAVMTWGGLRGAVGLALAIQVHRDRGRNDQDEPQIAEKDARRVLFYVGGIAFLTTIINAPSCPILVEWLGITARSETKVHLIKLIHSRMVEYTLQAANQSGAAASLSKLLLRSEEYIAQVKVRPQPPVKVPRDADSVPLLLEEMRRSRDVVSQLDPEEINLLGYDGETKKSLVTLLEEAAQREHYYEASLQGKSNNDFDWDMNRLFTEVFLNLVRAAYWRQIEARVLPPGSEEADVLLHSVETCLSYPHADLKDFDCVVKYLLDDTHVAVDVSEYAEVVKESNHLQRMITNGTNHSGSNSPGQTDTKKESNRTTRAVQAYISNPKISTSVRRWLESAPWNIFASTIIAVNVVLVAVEEIVAPGDDRRTTVWIILDTPFVGIFSLWVAMEAYAYQEHFFKLAWYVFDFVFAVFAVLGLVADIVLLNIDSDSESIFRISRVFKLLRLLRLFRLMSLLQILKKRLSGREYSQSEGHHMTKITALTAYLKAHLHAQRDFMELLVAAEDFERITSGNSTDQIQEEPPVGRKSVRASAQECATARSSMGSAVSFADRSSFMRQISASSCLFKRNVSDEGAGGGSKAATDFQRRAMFELDDAATATSSAKDGSRQVSKDGSRQVSRDGSRQVSKQSAPALFDLDRDRIGSKELKDPKSVLLGVDENGSGSKDMKDALKQPDPFWRQITPLSQASKASSMASQNTKLTIFGDDPEMIKPELARCLVQSQGTVYKASALVVRAVRNVRRETLEQISQVRESQVLVQDMEAMALGAVRKGALGERDIECITHPLHEHIRHCQFLIGKAVQGFEMGVELRHELAAYRRGTRQKSTSTAFNPNASMSLRAFQSVWEASIEEGDEEGLKSPVDSLESIVEEPKQGTNGANGLSEIELEIPDIVSEPSAHVAKSIFDVSI